MAVTDLADIAGATRTTAATPSSPGLTRGPSTGATRGTSSTAGSNRPLAEGDKVEVRRRLDDQWARGFVVAAASADGYRLRRLSDGVELPTTFPATDVRKERKRDFWWY